jgi:DNA-binding NarL/FixJ family response regulator
MTSKILLVEDHTTMRRTLADWLQMTLNGCSILEAATGEEALLLTQQEMPHLIVMDIALPGINGIETTRRLKAMYPMLQIVILSMLEGPAYRHAAREAGAVAYVPKSALHTQFMSTIATLLACTTPPPTLRSLRNG